MHFAFILKGYIWCVEGWPRLMLAAGGDVSWHRRRPHSASPAAVQLLYHSFTTDVARLYHHHTLP